MKIDRISTPLGLNARYAAWMSGASALHAAHHVAPKVSHTACPLCALSETGLPSTVVAVKSCAGVPIFGGAPSVGPDREMACRPPAVFTGRLIR